MEVIENLKSEGYKVIPSLHGHWIVYREDVGRILCKNAKELNKIWLAHYSNFKHENDNI